MPILTQLDLYRYESKFALSVFDERGKVERHNIFHVLMLIRHSRDGKMYLYAIYEFYSNPAIS